MMQLKRWITAIIALPLLIALVYKGHPVLFFLFVGLVSVLALWEYFRIVYGNRDKTSIHLISGLGFAVGLMIIWAAFIGTAELMIGMLAVNLILSGLIAFLKIGSDANVSDTLIKQNMGTLYVPLLLSFLILIRNEIQGIGWLFFLMAVVFSGDSFAYYGGTYLGRHKLCPLVSPGKTVEGSVAGLLANVGAGYLFRNLMALPISGSLCLILSLSLGIAGQIGDLFESLLKRSADVKDSGGILPGHGGVLDRIDATLFAAPVLYLFIRYVI
jgi:phosphatidate cytidylyltransferase